MPTLGQPVSKPPKLWNEEDVPDVDSPAFRQLIFRAFVARRATSLLVRVLG